MVLVGHCVSCGHSVEGGELMTDADRSTLRQKAEKATPGPWKVKRSTTGHYAGSPMCEATCGTGMVPDSVSPGAGKGQWAGCDLHDFTDDAVDDISAGDKEHAVFCAGHDYEESGVVSVANAEYIAAVSPDVLLTLLDHEAALREMVKTLTTAIEDVRCSHCGFNYSTTAHCGACEPMARLLAAAETGGT